MILWPTIIPSAKASSKFSSGHLDANSLNGGAFGLALSPFFSIEWQPEHSLVAVSLPASRSCAINVPGVKVDNITRAVTLAIFDLIFIGVISIVMRWKIWLLQINYEVYFVGARLIAFGSSLLPIEMLALMICVIFVSVQDRPADHLILY